jgi:hypothetical protein
VVTVKVATSDIRTARTLKPWCTVVAEDPISGTQARAAAERAHPDHTAGRAIAIPGTLDAGRACATGWIVELRPLDQTQETPE